MRIIGVDQLGSDKLQTIKWLFLFIAVLGSEAWFLAPDKNWSFEWEPLLALITSFSVFLFFNWKMLTSEKSAESDTLLLRKLNEPFSQEGSLSFFRNHDFGGSFLDEYTLPLERFINTFNDYEHEFNDAVIEKRKQDTLSSAKKLRSLLAKHTFFVSKTARKIYPEHNPDEKKIERDETNEAATDFYENYSLFIREAQKKLKAHL